MDLLRHVLLFVHLLAFAALIGGLLFQLRQGRRHVNSLMRDGSGTAFLTGLALVGVLEAGDGAVDHAKVGVKLVVGLVVLGLVMANLRKELISDAIYYSISGLTVVNVAVAVFWSSAHAS